MDSMTSILPGLINQFSPQIVKAISAKTGMSEQMVSQGIAMAVPLIIAMLAKKSATPEGATDLGKILSSQPPSGDLASSIDAYQPKADDPVLGQIFGDQTEQISSALGKSTGGNGSELLGMVAPAVLGSLSQTQQAQGLDTAGMAKLLQQEASNLPSDQMATINGLLGSEQAGGLLATIKRLFGM